MHRTQHFDILIDAPRQRVWATMLDSPSYEQWTGAFCEGSHFEGSWDEGQTIRFLDSQGNGIVAVVAEHRPAWFVSIRLLGQIQHGVEDTTGDPVRAWAPCHENYTFADDGSATRVSVDADVFGDVEAFMAETWPKALARLKAICEEQP